MGVAESQLASRVARVLTPVSHDLGGLMVRRALPSPRTRVPGNRSAARMVGPFVFIDQFGPASMRPGQGFDVRPHPHIGLATVTYLFDGGIVHRDSLGFHVEILPGEVNWMTAGRGIVHSERTAPARRRRGGMLSGFQTWVALPKADEEMAPAFAHHPSTSLPVIDADGMTVRVVAGRLFGERSPVATRSETLYADILLEAGARFPVPSDMPERALYLAEGRVEIAGDRYAAPNLLLLYPGDEVVVTATSAARLMLLGGEPLDGERFLWWNFVSSSLDRIEQAKSDWCAGRFPPVAGENEFIPLPG